MHGVRADVREEMREEGRRGGVQVLPAAGEVVEGRGRRREGAARAALPSETDPLCAGDAIDETIANALREGARWEQNSVWWRDDAFEAWTRVSSSGSTAGPGLDSASVRRKRARKRARKRRHVHVGAPEAQG